MAAAERFALRTFRNVSGGPLKWPFQRIHHEHGAEHAIVMPFDQPTPQGLELVDEVECDQHGAPLPEAKMSRPKRASKPRSGRAKSGAATDEPREIVDYPPDGSEVVIEGNTEA